MYEHEIWIWCIYPNCFLLWQGVLTQLHDHVFEWDVTHIVLFQSENAAGSETDSLQNHANVESLCKRPDEHTTNMKHSQPQRNEDSIADEDTGGIQPLRHLQRLQTKGQKVGFSSGPSSDTS